MNKIQQGSIKYYNQMIDEARRSAESTIWIDNMIIVDELISGWIGPESTS